MEKFTPAAFARISFSFDKSIESIEGLWYTVHEALTDRHAGHETGNPRLDMAIHRGFLASLRRRQTELGYPLKISVLIASRYNHCIALHKHRYYRLFHKGLNKYKLQKHLAKISKLPGFHYLKEFGSQALQNVTERISFGYKKFFEKQNQKPPKFRKLHKFKSFTLKQAGWKLDGYGTTVVRVDKFFPSSQLALLWLRIQEQSCEERSDPRMGLPGMRHAPRSGQERSQEHPERRAPHFRSILKPLSCSGNGWGIIRCGRGCKTCLG